MFFMIWLFDIDYNIQKNWWDFLIESHDFEIICITHTIWKTDKFDQEVQEDYVVGLSQDFEFVFDYFHIVDNDIGDAKFDEQFVGYNPLPLVWVGRMDEEDLHSWVDRF